MARKNGSSPENGVSLATKVSPEVARKAKIIAMIDGGVSVSDWLRTLVEEAVEEVEAVQIVRNGETVEL